jgi:hypothetical protein
MFRIISHIIFSGFILLSMTGININLHYCQDELYDVAVNAPADNCCENDAHHHPCHANSDMDKSHQCEDETLKVASADYFFVSWNSINFTDYQVIDLFGTTPIFSAIEGIANITTSEVLHFKKPPTLPEVVLSQVQSFLI